MELGWRVSSAEPDLDRILRDAPPGTPLIPVHLDRVWGSLFSFHGKRFVWKRPRRFSFRARPGAAKPPWPCIISSNRSLRANENYF
jgi:hypothetical protein